MDYSFLKNFFHTMLFELNFTAFRSTNFYRKISEIYKLNFCRSPNFGGIMFMVKIMKLMVSKSIDCFFIFLTIISWLNYCSNRMFSNIFTQVIIHYPE